MTTQDDALLERAREYDPQAMAEIYDCYAVPIYRYLYRYLGDAPLAEDLTSEVFLKLLQVLGTSRAPRRRLRGWLYRVAHNLAMDWFRRHSQDDPLPLEEELVADGVSALAMLEEHEGHHHLRQAIRQLTPSQQQVILLRFGEGLKIREVSQLMGKSEGAIKLIQHRAVKHLKKILDRNQAGQNEKRR